MSGSEQRRYEHLLIDLAHAERMLVRRDEVITHLLDEQAHLILRVRWLEAQLSHRTAPDQGEGGAI